jgi:glutaredoxin/glutathione-dependent peroxiredoxin
VDFPPSAGYKAPAKKDRESTLKEICMAITPGDRLPDAKFKIMTATGPSEVTAAELFKGKKAVLFAVPGAFTPTCHGMHLPGFLRHADDFKAKGVELIACTAVNDVFVMGAWAKASGAEGKITFLADGNGDFAKAIGLGMDGTAVGFGIRSKRYAMLIEDGTVKALHVEEKPSSAQDSSAERLLGDL